MKWLTKPNELVLAKNSPFKHGFKAKAERYATAYREELGIHPCGPLCAFKLASHLNIGVYGINEFPITEADLQILKGSAETGAEWSGHTMTTKIGNKIVLHNTFQSPARQQSNVMHELAHIICEHKTPELDIDFPIPLGMRYYDEVQEEEAKYLGAALQLGKPCLLWAKKQQMTKQQMAEYFNASIDMITYRMNITGISKIY